MTEKPVRLAVLADSSPKDAATVTRLKELGRLDSGGLVQVGDVLSKSEADLEDLFMDAFYLGLVNDAYAGALKGKTLKPNDLPAGDQLTKRVEQVFANQGIDNGRLNHFAPTAALMRRQDAFTLPAPQTTLDKAAELFARINAFMKNSE